MDTIGIIYLLCALVLFVWLVVSIREKPQAPTKPPDSVVVRRTQAVRRSALYGLPDVDVRAHNEE